MQTINVKVEDLLKVLKENRQKHEAIYNEAVAGYRIDAEKKLKQQLKTLRNGGKIELYLGLAEPVSKVQDYDKAIAMLEMTTDEVVSLNQTEFAQYVQDEWGWKETFTSSNSRYLGKTHG